MPQKSKYVIPETFDEYLNDICSAVRAAQNPKNVSEISKYIRRIKLIEDEVLINREYFLSCYNSKILLEKLFLDLVNNEDELYRKANNFTSSVVIDEIINRGLEYKFISDISTDDLEAELSTRWDSDMTYIHDISDDDLIDELSKRGYPCNDSGINDKPRDLICKVLGFYNSFACTDEDIINALRKKLKKYEWKH